MTKFKDSERTNYIIQNWMRNRNTIEFIDLWKQLKNPNFKSIEFDAFKTEAGANSFSLTPKRWIEKTNALVLYPKLVDMVALMLIKILFLNLPRG